MADIGQLVEIVRTEQRGVPLALHGHSMGSFAVQQFILDHSDQTHVVVLSGTGAGDALAGAIDTTKPLELGAFSAAFEPARTPFDWLSRDAAVPGDVVGEGWEQGTTTARRRGTSGGLGGGPAIGM